MTKNQDEFWGTQADWPDVAEGNRREPRATAGRMISRWWNNIVGGGAEATREHGALPAAPQGVDPVDDDVDPPGVDPLLARFGAAAIVLTLLVPVYLGFESNSDDGGSALAAAESAAIAGVPAPSAATDVATATTAVTPSSAPPAAAIVGQSVASSSPEPSLTSADPSSGGVAAGDVTTSGAAEGGELSCAVDYEVVAGDFWIRLAGAADVALADLLDANEATTDTALYPGRTICLPAGATTPAPPTTKAPVTTVAPTPTTVAPTPTTSAARPTATTSTATTSPTTTGPPVRIAAAPTAAQVQQIIRDVWPDELEDRAIEVARRESTFVPTARNNCCYGLFQIYFSVHHGWLDDLGVTSADQLFDPATNARAAYALYQRSRGWGPWGF